MYTEYVYLGIAVLYCIKMDDSMTIHHCYPWVL